jgi:hypothetical protein
MERTSAMLRVLFAMIITDLEFVRATIPLSGAFLHGLERLKQIVDLCAEDQISLALLIDFDISAVAVFIWLLRIRRPESKPDLLDVVVPKSAVKSGHGYSMSLTVCESSTELGTRMILSCVAAFG